MDVRKLFSPDIGAACSRLGTKILRFVCLGGSVCSGVDARFLGFDALMYITVKLKLDFIQTSRMQ